MQNIHIRKVLKRGVTLLLTFTLLLTALPRGAKAEDVTITSGEGGVASFLPGNGDKTYFTIIATPHSNYVFDYWESTCTADASYNNKRFYGSQLTMPYARSGGGIANVTFKANFRLKNEPVYGVSVQVESGYPERGVVSGGKQATDDRTEVTTNITATPNEGFEFLYWSNNDDQTKNFYERSMQVTAPVGYHVIYTAHFDYVENARGAFTAVAGIDDSGVRIDGLGGTAVGDAVYSKGGVATQQTVLQAIPATNDYAFSHWERIHDDETEPTKFTANPLPVTVENHRDVYTAVFVAGSKASGVFVESGHYENSTWTSGGGIATGGKLYDLAGGVGQQTTLQAFPVSTEWVFQKWEKSNATGWEAAGYSPTIAVPVTDAHTVYRAVFIGAADAKGVQTTVRLIGGAAGEGGTATGDKVYSESVGAGQQTTLQAFPRDPSVVFAYWERTRDGGTAEQISSANPYAVKVENHKDVYTAVFRAVGSAGVFTAVRLEGGTAGEVPGSVTGDKAYSDSAGAGQQTTLQAFPASNAYVFTHWELSSGGGAPTTASSANPYSVKVENHKDVYTAVFIKTPDNSPVPVTPKKTGITDGPFLDVWRKFTSPNYGTTRESMEEKAAVAVNESRGRLAGASPDTGGSAALARLRDALSGKSADKTKDRREMSDLPEDILVTSDGDSYTTEDVGAGDHSDSANELVQKRFGNLYDYEILQLVGVRGPAAEDGRDTTMVWKYTGAEEKDRLLLVRFLPDGTQNIATPVADGDGTVTFTLPAVAYSEYMLLKVFLLDNAG